MLLTTPVAFAQSFVRPELHPRVDGVQLQLNLWLAGDFSGGRSRHGVWFWGVLSDGFAEGIGGYSYRVSDSLQMGIGLGPSTEPGCARWSPFVSVGRGRFSTLLIFEDGAGGTWYQLQSGYALTPSTSTGFLVRKRVGVGPFVETRVGTKPGLSFLAFLGVNEGSLSAMISLRKDF